MSHLVDNSLEKLANCEFIFQSNRTLEVRDAVIIWTNFKGEANQFGNTTKNFNLVINEEVKTALEADPSKKIRVHSVGGSGPDDPIMYFINVKINMTSAFPPAVTLYSDLNGKKSKVELDDGTIGCLDRIDIESCDCIINLYENKMHAGTVSCYLKKLNVIQSTANDFGGKYVDWDIPANPELVEQNAAFIDDDLPFGK